MAKKTVAPDVPANSHSIESADSPKRAKISQADIPAYSLAEAIKVPRAIAENYGRKPTAPLKVAAGMNVQPNSSSFRMVTGAAMAYGLTKGGPNAPLIEITPLGLRVLKPTKEGDDLAAKREAILKPRVIGKFLTQYDNSPVPRTDIALNVLSTDMGVPEERAAAVFDMIMEGARAVGFVQKIKEKEYISLDGAGEPEEDEIYDATEPIESLTDSTESGESGVRTNTPPLTQSASNDTLELATKRVFITHGKNKDFIDPIKKIITYGKYEAVVAEEKQSVSKPVPDKVMGSMRSCGAAIIHVDVEKVLKDEDEKEVQILNPNVLTEIGAAQALYGRRFILLVEDGVKLPSNLQGLYEVRYSGEKLDANDAFKLLDAMQDIQNHPIPDRYKE